MNAELPSGFSIVTTKYPDQLDLRRGDTPIASSYNRQELIDLAVGIAERVANPSHMSIRQRRAAL